MSHLTYDTSSDPHVFDYAFIDGVAPSSLWLRLTHAAAISALAPLGGPPLSVVDVRFEARSMHARYRAPVELEREERLIRAHAQSWSDIFAALESLGMALGSSATDGHFAFAPDLAAHVDEVSLLTSTLGLTPAEARVSLSLAAGRTPAAVAAHLQIAIGTVRSHLKRAYAKTNTRGQRQLVEVIAAHRHR